MTFSLEWWKEEFISSSQALAIPLTSPANFSLIVNECNFTQCLVLVTFEASGYSQGGSPRGQLGLM